MKLTKKQKIYSLSIAGFIWAISMAQIAYVQSTFLNQFFDIKIVSIIFFIAYAIAFIAINEYQNIVVRFTNFKTTLVIFFIEILALLAFIFIDNSLIIIIAFFLYVIAGNLLAISFDIFLEAYTTDTETGRIRGMFLTIYNLGWVVSPIISGKILSTLGFDWLFALVIFLIFPVVFIIFFAFRDFKYKFNHNHFKISKTIREIMKHPNLEKIFCIAFLLQAFYAVMTVYTPIYLNKTIGLDWTQIGLIFSIMLIPFVLVQYPAGYIADKYIGEKELLTTGIIITAFSALLIFFINTSSLVVWILVLFLSRIGASLIEIMRDTYFFKKVEVRDIEILNAFRSTMPLAYVFIPLIFSGILYFLPINYIFLVISLIMLSGLYSSLTLKDTK